MLEKIKKELDPKIEVELSEMKKRIVDLEMYVSENENTEDEGVMIKILTSINIIKRLNKEQPVIEERLNLRNDSARSILKLHEWLKGKKDELEKVEKLTEVLENFNKDMADGNIKSARDLMVGIHTQQYSNKQGIVSLSHRDLDSANETMLNFKKRLEHEISKTIRMLKEYLEEYPALKKVLKV